jgi:hypothetical protein
VEGVKLTTSEGKALGNISCGVWFCTDDVKGARLSTLNNLHDKGYLDRVRKPGPYIANKTVMFRRKDEV